MKNKTMVRCVRMWTGADQNSHFEEGFLQLKAGPRGDLISDSFPATHSIFQQTSPGESFDWHTDPIRRFVVTLSGILDFQTREGKHFQLSPGKILLAEDTVGTGHSWKIIGEDPWCRLYVVLKPGVVIPFLKD